MGLDTDLHKLPTHFKKEPESILAFNLAIIEATSNYAVSYKINTAFYESLGAEGWHIMQKTLAHIPDEVFTIADAKRGDIGNTSSMYARAFFEQLPFDSITVNPYMGHDSVQPFLQFEGKWTILLALTSNTGSGDFQSKMLKAGSEELYKTVLKTSSHWGTAGNMMYVVGATKAESLSEIRKIIPDHFLLIPGVGAQGGSLQQVVKYGMNKDIGLLINASRSIIYASDKRDFAEAAAFEAKKMQEEMSSYID